VSRGGALPVAVWTMFLTPEGVLFSHAGGNGEHVNAGGLGGPAG